MRPASAIPLDEYSFESMEILRKNIAEWQRSITAGRCQDHSDHKDPINGGESDQPPGCEAEREHLLNLPTSFRLESEDVDRLKAAARTVLGESKAFQSLLNDLR